MNWVPNLVDGIREVDTPLKLLALIVVAFTITIAVVFSTGAELVQLLSIGALVLVVLASIAVVFLRANWSPNPTEPLLGADHLPLEFEQKHILQNGTWRCRWTARDVTGDLKDYARDTIFEGRIAHGMLTAGLISAVIGEQLPGHGTVYMSQNLKFLAPVRPGDLVRAEVTVTGIEFDKRRVTLDCECTIDGKKVLVGEAKVLAPSRKFD